MSETGAIALSEAMLNQYAEVVQKALAEAETYKDVLEPHWLAAEKLAYHVGLPVLLGMARAYKNVCLRDCKSGCDLGYGSQQCYVQKGQCDVRTEVRRVDEALWKAGVRT